MVPETANDISLAVKTLTDLYVNLKNETKVECSLAIRSGGHTPRAGIATRIDTQTFQQGPFSVVSRIICLMFGLMKSARLVQQRGHF